MEVCSGERPLECFFSSMGLSCKCSIPACIAASPSISSLQVFSCTSLLNLSGLIQVTPPFVLPLTLVEFTQPLKPCPSLFGVVCVFACLFLELLVLIVSSLWVKPGPLPLSVFNSALGRGKGVS